MLIVASPITTGEAQNLNLSTESPFKQCYFSVEMDFLGENTDSDSFDGLLFTHASLVSKCVNDNDLSRPIYVSNFHTVSNFSIRAPPTSLLN